MAHRTLPAGGVRARAAGARPGHPGRWVRGGAVCPNLLQRPRSRRSARGESLIVRASSRGRSRPGAPLKVIRRVSGRISGRRYCEGCSGSGSGRVPRVWCEGLSRALGRGAGRDGPPGSPPGVPGGRRARRDRRAGRRGRAGWGGGGSGVPRSRSAPMARPAWWDGVSHVVTRPARLDHLRAVGPLAFRWTTVFREPGGPTERKWSNGT